jgi:hypothetical protein
MPSHTHSALPLLLTLLAACSSSSPAQETAPQNQDGGLPETAAESSLPETSAPISLALPQAVHGALWANPDVYSELPLRVIVTGTPESVTVSIPGATVQASDPENDGTWLAMLPTAGLPLGVSPITVTAGEATLTADLGIGRQGVQWTSFAEAASAATPRIHTAGDRAWLTWTDRSAGPATAWLREIDGAGRWVGERTALTQDPPALYARTAVSAGGALSDRRIGVLYQSLGSPYRTRFRVVDFAGTESVAPIALDPQGWDGSFGGDIVWDGVAFTLVWRVFEAPVAGTEFAHSKVLWARVGLDGAMTGPAVVAESGDGKPVAGFNPFSFVKVDALGALSVVSFVRDLYQFIPDTDMPKGQVAVVKNDGTVSDSIYLAGGDGDPYSWFRDCRVRKVGAGFVLLWTAKDIMEAVDNPRNVIVATRADAQGNVSFEEPVKMVDAPGDRDEPFLLAHPEQLGILAWLDARSYELDVTKGRIEMYVAAVGDELVAKPPVIFPHARFVAGTSDLNLSLAGTNALMTWVDERHGLGIADPKPEIYFETAWY